MSFLIVRTFKTAWFTRYADKKGIPDDELRRMVNQLEMGQAIVNLGGNVYKVRTARSGEGKSGGYRVIVFFKSGERTFYAYGFEKSDMANISNKELKKLKKQACSLFSMSEIQIIAALKEGVLYEIQEE